MNKKAPLMFLIALLFSVQGWAQGEAIKTFAFWGYTRMDLGFVHLGSYSKERPILYLEQELNYHYRRHVSFGIGLGVNLYPGALAFPVSVGGKYHFKIGERDFHWGHFLGMNVRLGELSFSSRRYSSNCAVLFRLKNHISIAPEIGYSFLWDRYGGKALSFLGGVGLKYYMF